MDPLILVLLILVLLVLGGGPIVLPSYDTLLHVLVVVLVLAIAIRVITGRRIL